MVFWHLEPTLLILWAVPETRLDRAGLFVAAAAEAVQMYRRTLTLCPPSMPVFYRKQAAIPD